MVLLINKVRGLKLQILLKVAVLSLILFLPTSAYADVLSLPQGGTGRGSFTAGSVMFSDGTAFAQDNANLFWDDTNNRLGIHTSSPTSTLDVVGDTSILGSLKITDSLNLGQQNGAFITQFTITTPNGIDAPPGTTDGTAGTGLLITTGSGGRNNDAGDFNSGGNLDLKTGNGGFISLDAGDALGFNNNGGYIQLSAGNGTNPNNQGGYLEIAGGDDSQNVGGSISLAAGSGLTDSGDIVLDTDNDGNIILNPGQTGSVKIEADLNSTIYVGSSIKSGCIALGDSDGNGITYITANEGIITASSTKPSICQ